jgi:hypothetical protein
MQIAIGSTSTNQAWVAAFLLDRKGSWNNIQVMADAVRWYQMVCMGCVRDRNAILCTRKMEDLQERAAGPEQQLCPFHPDCRHPAEDHYRTGRKLRQQSELPPLRDSGWVRVPLPDMNGSFF